MISTHTERRLLFLPAAGLGLFAMVTLSISGCGESATPEAESTGKVVIKNKSEAEKTSAAAKKQAGVAKTENKPSPADETTGDELRLPGLPDGPDTNRQTGEQAHAAPGLTSPSSVLSGEHPPLKRQPSKFEQRFKLDPAGADASAQHSGAAASVKAASIQEAHRVIDLRKLQEPAGAKPLQVSPTQMSLTSSATLAELKTFYEQQLLAEGWEPVKSETTAVLTPEYGQLEFAKEGFQLGVMLSRPTGENLTSISIHNYGNLDARDLPRPEQSQELFSNAMSVLYVTAKDVATAADACIAGLAATGWQVYQHPYTMITESKSQRSLSLKQNGVGLSVYISVAPAQQNRTTVQYSLQMLGDDLPAPKDARAIEFLESPLQLSCDTEQGIKETLEFYRQQLAQAGWKESGEANEQPTEAVAVFQRSEGLPIVLRLNRIQDGQLTHVAIAEFEMPQDAPAAVTHQGPPRSPLTEGAIAKGPTAENHLADSPPAEAPLLEVPHGQPKELPGVLPGLMTFEDWLKKNNYQASPERLNQFAKEMEEIANRSADVLPKEPTVEKSEDGNPSAGLIQTLRGLPRFGKPAETTSLDLRGSKIDSAQLKLLGQQPHLTQLNLSASNISDQDLPALLTLTRLEILNLSETAITDAAIPQLIQLRSLREMDLSGTKISPAGLKTLSAALPECDIQQ